MEKLNMTPQQTRQLYNNLCFWGHTLSPFGTFMLSHGHNTNIQIKHLYGENFHNKEYFDKEHKIFEGIASLLRMLADKIEEIEEEK